MQVNTLIRAGIPAAAMIRRDLMKTGWFQRLIKAIEDDGRSYTAISLAAKCGQNYVQQMIHNGKEPGADRLARLLDALGGPSALYVLAGITATEDDLEVLRLIQDLPPDAKEQAIRFFAALRGPEGN